MSIETRHREMDILYRLLMLPEKIKAEDSVDDVIANLSASMEADDVALVEKKVMERKSRQK